MTRATILLLEDVRGIGEHLPAAALTLTLAEGDFAVVESPGPRRGSAFADLCSGLARLRSGRVCFHGHDWSAMPTTHADALRGRIGRLFNTPLHPDTPEVSARILLASHHHTRTPTAALRGEAAALALRFGLPGLPAGPARHLSGPDLLRAACVRAFLGDPRLLILELPLAAQGDDLLAAVLAVGAEARGRGAAVLWLAAAGPALRDRSLGATHRLRLTESGLLPGRHTMRAA